MEQNFFQFMEQGAKKGLAPCYLVLGGEPFQEAEVLGALKGCLVKDISYQYERFDGEESEASELLNALKTFTASLFAEENAPKLIYCSHFEKIAPSELTRFESYFEDPIRENCFLMTAEKVDRRKGWYKKMESTGVVIEVREPYDREWPKWQQYFLARLGKTVEPMGWQYLIESCDKKLSLVWAELQKVALYVGEKKEIRHADIHHAIKGGHAVDVFSFVEDVVLKRKWPSIRKLNQLRQSEENEMKLLSLLVRQFRLVEQYSQLTQKGERDPKILASKLGVPPFVVNNIAGQAQRYTPASLLNALELLADCDYRMKTGRGDFFESFLIPFFRS